MKDILVALDELLKIESEMGEPSEGAPFGAEPKRALDYMLGLAEEMGFVTKNVDGYAGHIEWGEGEEILGILTHLDIVPAGEGWSCQPYGLTKREGLLLGRGVVDNKGPAIICLYALKKLKDEGFVPSKKIRLILGCNEENGSECIKYYKSKERMPDLAFVPDADFPLINSEKLILRYELAVPLNQEILDNIEAFFGGARFNMVAEDCTVIFKKDAPIIAQILQKNWEGTSLKISQILEEKTKKIVLKTKGKSAHAMHPNQGKNAISEMICLLNALRWGQEAQKLFSTLYTTLGKSSLAESLGADFSHESSGFQTINLGLVRQENSWIFTLDCRCPHTVLQEELEAKILKKFPQGTTLKCIYRADGLFVDPASTLVTTLLSVYAPYATQGNKPLHTGGGTYARELPNAVAFGPTFENQETKIHDADEHMSQTQFDTLMEIYLKAIKELS